MSDNAIPIGGQMPMTPEMIKASIKQEAINEAKNFSAWMVTERMDIAEYKKTCPANDYGSLMIGHTLKELQEFGNVIKSISCYPIGAVPPQGGGDPIIIRQFSIIVERKSNRLIT